ncbi:TonB-dependent receptor [Novosphingobium flavum]|uniref:TonB-dependent receptor n=1 Tax=Novosphingobium flavum TaxID=1778672 RepID=UPI003CCDE029
MKGLPHCAALLLAGTLLAPAPAAAQDSAPGAAAESDAAPAADAIVVFGRGELKIGVAQAASEGTISGADLLVRPLLRTAELLEAVPGMVAAQHSGSGKANQYFLRGFNLDHGSDFSTYIDGVPMNFRTHGHGQGYLDLNGLIPEVVAREDFRKGPYRADGGDFSMAGAAYMTTLDKFDRPWISLEGGSYGHRRVAAGGTIEDKSGGKLTMVGEFRVYDGPWQEPEHLRHYAGLAKYERQTSLGELELTVHGYRGTWRPTEQIPERAIGTAICADVFCSPDPTATGQTTRIVSNAKLSGADWRANAYAQYYNWDMYSNPEYHDDAGQSAQIHQFDRRWTFGLNGEKTWALGDKVEVSVGTENRFDSIGKVGVVHTDARRFVNSFGLYSVDESSLAGYTQVVVRPVEGLRLIGGLRGDWYHYSVRALDAEAASIGTGSGSKGLVSPKIQAAYQVNDNIELYANWGRGFHSNDVRGTVTATPVPALVAGTGKELGARFQFGKFSLTATYWWLNLGSELKFVGDTNAVEPTGASRRHGYELVAFWRPFDWLAIDANYTASHARYDNGDYIPNSFENAAAAGISLVKDAWEGSVRLRHLGPYPLIEDNSQRDKGSNVVNLRGARKLGRFEAFAEVLNLFDSRDKDMTYWYTAYLPAIDAEPTEGRLSRVVEPRTLRVGFRVNL